MSDRIVIVLIAALVSFTLGYQFGVSRTQEKRAKEKVELAALALETQTKQAEITQKVDQQSVEVQERIKTVFKDRIIYRTKEVPHEVIVRQDAACVVPVGFVSLWNTANRAEVPDPASGFDESPSGVELSDIAAQKDAEAELCSANTEQLKSLQAWVKGQQDAVATK
jgi:hypothetical protein